MTLDSLKTLAASMRDRAYCPYSNFSVGAALECSDGTVFTGCNVENAVYPAGICAERNAIFHAVAEGHRDFKRIVIAGSSREFCFPCGICLQVMQEFSPDLRVCCLNNRGACKELSLKELLPYGFNQQHLSGAFPGNPADPPAANPDV